VAHFVPLYERAGFTIPGCVASEGADIQGKALVTVRGYRPAVHVRVAYVSGWAALESARERTGADELIPYSDHAGFDELSALVEQSGAREIDVVHGYAEEFAAHLVTRGFQARPRTAPFPRCGAL
jgi:putative mRNA 3-end processing factor